MAVREMDFAKQQDNLIVTAGDDCKLRLWDLRRASGICRCESNSKFSPTTRSWQEAVPKIDTQFLSGRPDRPFHALEHCLG